MSPKDLLTYALEHDLVNLEVEEDCDEDECMNIDLEAGVNANGYTIDGGFNAEMVRKYQSGEIANYVARLYTVPHTCHACGQNEEPQLLTCFVFASNTLNPMVDDDTMESLASEAHEYLAKVVATHRRENAA